MVLVAVCGREQGATLPPETIPVVTYGGVTMSFLRIESGIESFITGGSASRVSVFWFALRESELPPNGANDLIVNWAALAGTNWGFRSEWYLLGNADQGPITRWISRLATTSGTQPLNGVLNTGGVSDAIYVAGMNVITSGSFQITIDGVGIVEDADAVVGSLGRVTFGHDLSAASVGFISYSLAFTNGNNVAAVALRIAEFFPTDGQARLTQGPASLVTLDAL